MDVLLSCAGVADGTPGIERINFIGHRHMIDTLIAGGMLGRGAAIGFISSAAGLGWEANLAEIQEFLATPDFDSAVAWVEAHGKADYMSTKQAICAYVAGQAFPLLKQGIRINAICPGPTDTPLAQANKDMWLGFGVRLPRRGRHRGRHPSGAGLPAGLPVQRRRRRHHRDHHGHRLGLHELGYHRLVPGGHRHRQLAAQPVEGGRRRSSPDAAGPGRGQTGGRGTTATDGT